MSTFSTPTLDLSSTRHYRWGQLYGCSYGLAVRKAALSIDSPLLILVSGSQQLDELLDQLHFFHESKDLPVLAFPDWETLPYDTFSPHQDIVSQRLEALSALPQLRQGLVITTTATLMQRISPPEYVQSHALVLNKGQQLDIGSFRTQLDNAGYYCVPKVTQHGEFAVRGSLIDIYPAGSQQPYRIDLFDDEIESIRTFDEGTQLTIEEIEAIQLLAAREYPLDEAGITLFRQGFRREFEGNPKDCPIYNDISDGLASAGAEYYLPLFFESTATLFDYLPGNTTLMTLDDALSDTEEYYAQIEERYEVHRYDPQRPILPPASVFVTPDEITRACAPLNRIDLQHYTHEQENRITSNFSTTAVPDIKINARAEDPARLLKQFIDSFDGHILLTAESAGQREMLQELLAGFGIHPQPCKSWHEFINNPARLCLTVAPFSEGVLFKAQSIAIITDQQILGKRSRQLSSRRRQRQAESVFNDLGELHIGSPVVHEEQGVGRYLGLQTLHVNDYAEEFLTLEYADNDKLYVPVASLHLINRYNGGPEESAPLHRLGSEQWQKVKRKAVEKIRDVAAELLDIYARRAARPGFAYPFDPVEYEAFADSFPFEETEDQHNAIQAVIEDLRSGSPMDRVVCGDVGFGKTEVAMRAAYVAAHAGKQVAILSPTTLLTQQHFQNFSDRFADWPVKVDVLSRFRSKKETDKTLKQLADGKVDIVIGTHKLLQKDVKFKNLGLLIIDEEHRFGVRQKEQLKKLRSEVDMLTLTATPIPRTLNMSLSGLRDLSIIATPPMQRLSVKTFVNEWRDLTVQEACFREIKRGGQVYFLHNDVSTIEKMAEDLRKLVPQARVEVAHGQMRERELENIMLEFYHRKFNILVCTTIIESGIDVATANTIVMNRADKLGLAQLHQLRGRVGRSHHQAYAYLIVPPRKAMSADAIKRVEAVESLEDLGAGFSLASHDLEIRGSGELLGEGQSGQISEIGFTLYTDLLNRAVTALKSGKTPELDEALDQGPEIELHIPALLPDDYLADVHMRLVLYKRIANAADDDELKALKVEMIDRFGLLPEAANNLFKTTTMKIQAKDIGISKIAANENNGRIVFMDQPDIDPMVIINLIQQAPQTYQFDGKQTLRFNLSMPTADERFSMINRLLGQLTVKKAA
ncbi:MAG: transcription-repair coupling factor [Gammaproteobacteria bacterium]|nr:transcription-repair coupling factor [Gammaproteobacteria bacterium]